MMEYVRKLNMWTMHRIKSGKRNPQWEKPDVNLVDSKSDKNIINMFKELKEFRVKDVQKAWKQWNQIENNKEREIM